MLRRALIVAVLAALATLVGVSSARGDQAIFIVSSTADGGGTCAPYPQVPGAFTCPTLRSAVAAAAADGGQDAIFLQQAATYTLTQGAINLTSDVTIIGPNAITTVIDAAHASRAFTVGSGVSAGLYGLTVANGEAASADGGNISNLGDLALSYVRVTGGTATNGGGIANSGTLQVVGSLIDANRASPSRGGAIYSSGAVTLLNSTIFNNDAGQVGGLMSVDGTVEVDYSTVGFNTSGSAPTGILTDGPWSANGSLFAQNFGDGVLSNCGNPASGAVSSIEDAGGCGFTVSNADGIGLSPVLTTDLGGQTGYLPIPSGGDAKGFVQPCADPVDQRAAPRAAGGVCDAGAFEEGAVAPPVSNPGIPGPGIGPSPTPPPTPGPQPTPPPSPSPSPAPTPVLGKTVVAAPLSGIVLVKLPGGKGFVKVDAAQGIPLGSIVDTRKGTVQITSKAGSVAKFYDGLFKLTQSGGVTTLTLTEPLAPCGKKGAKAAAKKPKTRKLWGNGSGSFSTRGHYSAATVRGTLWLVQDSCSGTLTRVKKGVVNVRDNVKRRTILLRAPHAYTARPRR